MKYAAILIPLLALSLFAGDESAVKLHPQEVQGTAQIIRREDVIKDAETNSRGPMRLLPLHSTPQSRMNYVEVTGRSGMHFHPDADHKLYVLEGTLLTVPATNRMTPKARDLIII